MRLPKSTPMLPILLSLIFFVSAICLLMFGHLHEDAYILFQYSKNLANGSGIVFDSVSGHAEGATDFLWMVVLSGLRFIGVDIAIGAAALNAIGVAVISTIIYRLRGRGDLVFYLCSVSVILSGGAAAALGGFSTLAYGGTFALLIYYAIQRNLTRLLLVSTLISLFRPDGVVLSLGTVFSTFFFLSKDERIRLLKMCVPVVLVGLGYFVWRSLYFDMPLPLPLMVKQKIDSVFEGLLGNFEALATYAPLVFLLLYMHFVLKALSRDAWIVFSGPVLLFIALCCAHQSQNVGYRFQFPIVLALIFLVVRFYPSDKSRWASSALLAVALLVSFYGGVQILSRDIKYLTNSDYINSFPQLLKDEGFKVDSIAITEAGRLPYWYSAEQMIDLVGLNSKEVVLSGPHYSLENHRPDVIFVHHAGRYIVRAGNEMFYTVLASDIQLVQSYFGKNPVFLAPAAALDFAKKNRYLAVFTRYGRYDTDYCHVYFLSEKADKDLFLRVLKDSFEKKIPYLESIRL